MHWFIRHIGILVALAIVLAGTRVRAAADSTCDGPVECCPPHLTSHPTSPIEVKLGAVLLSLSNVNERAGTFDADFYLYEQWPPTAGFLPQTELANEIERHNEQFDQTDLVAGACLRTRRIRSTMRGDYNLRRFPFDTQALTLVLSDDNFDVTQVRYSDATYALGLDEAVRRFPSGWKLEDDPTFSRGPRPFRWEPGAPTYDYATFAVRVRRHVSYHLTKYFLPLFIIVFIAFSVFWIDPDDLGSQVGIGVTCLLAAIALQYVEANSLPEVAYLTFADRVYACCYVAIAVAMVQSLGGNALVRRRKRALAVRLDRTSRWAFPLALMLAIAASAVRAFTG